jgi:hypothetical protein
VQGLEEQHPRRIATHHKGPSAASSLSAESGGHHTSRFGRRSVQWHISTVDHSAAHEGQMPVEGGGQRPMHATLQAAHPHTPDHAPHRRALTPPVVAGPRQIVYQGSGRFSLPQQLPPSEGPLSASKADVGGGGSGRGRRMTSPSVEGSTWAGSGHLASPLPPAAVDVQPKLPSSTVSGGAPDSTDGAPEPGGHHTTHPLLSTHSLHAHNGPCSTASTEVLQHLLMPHADGHTSYLAPGGGQGPGSYTCAGGPLMPISASAGQWPRGDSEQYVLCTVSRLIMPSPAHLGVEFQYEAAGGQPLALYG